MGVTKSVMYFISRRIRAFTISSRGQLAHLVNRRLEKNKVGLTGPQGPVKLEETSFDGKRQTPTKIIFLSYYIGS